jgi:ribosome-binding factor A
VKRRRSSPAGSRPRRVAEQVRQVVTMFLQQEARDPRIGLVTVTGVDVTGDLQRATVHYVVHGGSEQQSQTDEGLAAAASAVRRRIGAELQLRVVPEVVFVLDKGSEHAAHIARLLAGIEKPEVNEVNEVNEANEENEERLDEEEE